MKKLYIKPLIKECILEVLKENLSENFCPLSQGPNGVQENPYPKWNAEMAKMEEGMNVGVADYEPSRRRMDNLDDLCNHILDSVISPSLSKLPQDQKNYFKKNSIDYYSILSPDGSYHEGPGGSTGVINFYISGFTSQTLQEILDKMSEEFHRLNIELGPVKTESSKAYKSQVIRIPVIKNRNTYEGPPVLDMANVNAYHIFHNILQYEGENEFSMDAEELIQRIDSLSHDKAWVTKHIRPTKVTTPENPPEEGEEWKAENDPLSTEDSDEENPHIKIANQIGGGTVYHMGLSEEDIWKRIVAIYKVAKWAVDHKYKKIYVG